MWVKRILEYYGCSTFVILDKSFSGNNNDEIMSLLFVHYCCYVFIVIIVLLGLWWVAYQLNLVPHQLHLGCFTTPWTLYNCVQNLWRCKEIRNVFNGILIERDRRLCISASFRRCQITQIKSFFCCRRGDLFVRWGKLISENISVPAKTGVCARKS